MQIVLDIPKDQALIVDVEKEGTFLGIRYGFYNGFLYFKLDDILKICKITDLEDILAEFNLWWYGDEKWVYSFVAFLMGTRGNRSAFLPFIRIYQKIIQNKDILKKIAYR